MANHGRPKALFTEIPSGLATAGMPAVAPRAETRFRKAGACAVYSRAAPPSAAAWPPATAKPAGTVSAARRSVASERMAPGDQSARARGAPKFDELATSRRVGSSTRPGRVVFANERLSWIGPPAWKVPTGLSAPGSGMPAASVRASSRTVPIAASTDPAGAAGRSAVARASARGWVVAPAHSSSRDPPIAQLRRPSENVTCPVAAVRVATPRVVRWTVSPVARSTFAQPSGAPMSVISCRESGRKAPANAGARPCLHTVAHAPCGRGSWPASTSVRAGPRPSARIAARLPPASSVAVPNPSITGRGPIARRSPSWVCIPSPASAMTKHARVTMSTSATVSGSTRRAVRTIASARKPSRNYGKTLTALRRAAFVAVPASSP